MDIHLNTCLLCGTSNPSPPKQPPTTCSGCGKGLQLLRQLPSEDSFWGKADGYSDDRWRRRQQKKATPLPAP